MKKRGIILTGIQNTLVKIVSSEKFIKMEEFIKKTKYKKTVGVCLIIYGFIALITPFSPASVFSIFVGAELIGIKILFWEKIKARLKRKKAHLKDSGYEKK